MKRYSIHWFLFRGQLLPKKPELLNVFKHRRVEEKKREDERTREQTKLEQILARQRQKLDKVVYYSQLVEKNDH